MSWEKPIEVSDNLLAFPFKVVGSYLPEKNDIPIEYFEPGRISYQFAYFANRSTLPIESRAVIKNGIDARKAIRHIFVCLRSGEPDNDHKHAGVGYLVEKWFTEILTPTRNYVFSLDRENTHSSRIPEL